MKTTIRIALLALVAAPAVASAQGLNLSARGSTLGLGAEVGYAFNDFVNVRLAANNYSRDYNTTEDDIDYDFDFQLKSTALMLDIHPFAGKFRLTAGVLDNRNRLDGQAVPNGTYEIGDRTYQAEDVGTLYSSVILGDKNPLYLGLGWSKALGNSGFGFGFDVGVVMQGSPSVSLWAEGPIMDDPNMGPQFEEDLRAEERNLQDELSDFKSWPVIAFGVTYQF